MLPNVHELDTHGSSARYRGNPRVLRPVIIDADGKEHEHENSVRIEISAEISIVLGVSELF